MNYVFHEQNPEEVEMVRDLFNLTDQELWLLLLVHRRDVDRAEARASRCQGD